MATYSKTTICNIALSNLKQAVRLENVDTDTSVTAIDCRLHYPLALETMLEEFDNPLQTKNAALQLIIATPNNQWNYEYQYPNDCLSLAEIITGNSNEPRVRTVEQRIPFLVAHNSAGAKVIWTDQVTAFARYTELYENENQYSAHFIDALAWKLSTRLQPTLTKSDVSLVAAEQRYMIALGKYKVHALTKEQHESDPVDSFTDSRS